MLTLTLILASFSATFTDNADVDHREAVENSATAPQIAPSDLTLMDGYDRYLADPKMMLPVQRDA